MRRTFGHRKTQVIRFVFNHVFRRAGVSIVVGFPHRAHCTVQPNRTMDDRSSGIVRIRMKKCHRWAISFTEYSNGQTASRPARATWQPSWPIDQDRRAILALGHQPLSNNHGGLSCHSGSIPDSSARSWRALRRLKRLITDSRLSRRISEPGSAASASSSCAMVACVS